MELQASKRTKEEKLKHVESVSSCGQGFESRKTSWTSGKDMKTEALSRTFLPDALNHRKC